MRRMGWTDERVELLKKLWADGLSASQIAGAAGRRHPQCGDRQGSPSRPVGPRQDRRPPRVPRVAQAAFAHSMRRRGLRFSGNTALALRTTTRAGARPRSARQHHADGAARLDPGAHRGRPAVGRSAIRAREDFCFCGSQPKAEPALLRLSFAHRLSAAGGTARPAGRRTRTLQAAFADWQIEPLSALGRSARRRNSRSRARCGSGRSRGRG